MNIKYFNSILYSSCLMGLILLSNKIYAVDMEVLQEQCADIGFKIKTPANGKCVLRLMKSVKAEEKALAAQEQAYANQQAAQAAAQAAQIQQAEALRQQQAEMYELQRRAVAAQEQAAQAQADAVGDQQRQRYLNQFNDGIQKMTGTGAYAPPAQAPTTRIRCVTNFNVTTCN